MKTRRQPVGPRYGDTRRWERISIEMPLRFRHPGQTVWCEGIAANISSSGVLFRSDQVVEVHAAVHMSYSLPATIEGRTGLPVGCKGEVVRVETPTTRYGAFLFAVKILEYYPAA